MSRADYITSQLLADKPFYGLIMAAMRRADTTNLAFLQATFPTVWQELQARHNAPGGILYEEACQAPAMVYSPDLDGSRVEVLPCCLPPGHDGEHIGGVWG